MKILRALSSVAFAILLTPTLVFGQQAAVVQEDNFSLLLGGRTWFSSGDSEWTFAGSGGFPNIISELKWNDLDSIVVEFTADALFLKKYILTATVAPAISGLGLGTISDGTLRDLDYDGNNRTLLISDSIGAVEDDDLFYVNADLGYRILTWAAAPQARPGSLYRKLRGSLDVLVGYQHWREEYGDSKNVQLFPPPIAPFADQGRAITEEFTWDSVRVGARATVEFETKLAFNARLLFVPWSHLKLEDIHHMRPDLKKDPSGKVTAGGGFGVQFDATVSYNVWRGLSVEAGYQYWDISSGDGTITIRSLTPLVDIEQPFNGANSTRWGAIVGINYRF